MGLGLYEENGNFGIMGLGLYKENEKNRIMGLGLFCIFKKCHLFFTSKMDFSRGLAIICNQRLHNEQNFCS